VIDLSLLKITAAEEKSDYGRFIIEPLEQGFGPTLGNSLRRVLLSSLEGAAITQVKISGIRHQFSTLAGMSEDVIEFILNLKKVRLKITQDKPVKLTLEAKGSGQITAGDIKLPAGVTIVNPKQVLANLADKKSKLSCEMMAEKSKGYVMAQEKPTAEIGVIPIDSLFSPVTRVNFKVEGMRVGRLTNFDRLILEVYTDGTVKPQAAVKEAARILVDHLRMFYEPKAVIGEVKIEEQKQQIPEEVLKTTFEELDLPVRVVNALQSGKIETIQDFLDTPREKLLRMKNLGPKSISAVDEVLTQKNIKAEEFQKE